MSYVNKHTRAGNSGKIIFCPCGEHSLKVYHFSWSALNCSCGMIEKEDWSVKTEEK